VVVITEIAIMTKLNQFKYSIGSSILLLSPQSGLQLLSWIYCEHSLLLIKTLWL